MNTITKISAACALVCAGAQVQAATPATPFTPPALTIYLSGASAPQGFLGTLAGQLFDAGFYTYYNDAGTPTVTADDGTLYRSYYGTMKTTTDIPLSLRGLNVLITNRAKGGSVWGVNPVARNEAIATMPITAINCPNLLGGIYRCAEAGVDPGTGAPTGAEVIPDFGVSDVEPKMFKDPINVEFGFSQLTPGEALRITPASSVNILMMGLPVTNAVANFYISRASYGAALNGTITTWSGLGATTPAGGDDIVVCRRVPGSGTQAAYNWYFGNFPCGTSSVPATQPDTAVVTGGTGTTADPFVIDNTTGYVVLENSASGDVRNCLTKANTGGEHKFVSADGKTYSYTFAAGTGALGTLSVDSLGKEGGNWTFRTFDGAGNLNAGTQVVTGTGVAPTKANLIAGNYEFAVELSMQYRKSGANVLGGLKKTFVDLFIARAGQSAFNTQNWVAGLPGSVNACGTANTATTYRSGDTCGNFARACP